MKIAVLGCGSRGRTYSRIAAAWQGRYQLTAACDLIESRARLIANLGEGVTVFTKDDDFFAAGKLADIVIIATQDRDHFGHALRAIEAGYDVLLEKPAAQSLEECEILDRKAKEHGVKIGLCFVLRYTPFYRTIRSVIDSGRLGRIISIHASEGVEPYHQAHSFVRGHWAISADSTPMILAKCSHDTDLLCWFTDSQIKNVSSFGRLEYFQAANAPIGATARCSDGCPHVGTCFYDAHRYLTDKRNWLRMVLDGAETASDGQITQFIQSSPWGRCVYHCDNDVVDHQVISGEMENGISVTFSMTAFDMGRSMEIYGTKGSLKGGHAWKEAGAYELSVRDHTTGATEEIIIEHPPELGYAGHGGGDEGIVDSLDRLFGPQGCLAPGLDGFAGHQFALLAEKARVEETVVCASSGK
jgi:predicted dehydrogenase